MEEITVNQFYHTKEFLDKLDRYYDEHRSFTKVAEILSDEYNRPVNKQIISNLYKKLMSKKVLNEDKDFFEKSFTRMQKQLEDAWEMIEDITQDYKTVRKVIRESNLDEYSKALKMLARINDVMRIVSEVRKQFEFISKSQNEIKNYQQNNLNVNVVQFNQEYKNILNKLGENELKSLFDSTENKTLKKLVKLI